MFRNYVSTSSIYVQGGNSYLVKRTIIKGRFVAILGSDKSF